MSNFTKTVLAVIVGMLIISILPWIFWLIFIGIIAAGTSSTGNVNSPGILKLDLSTTSITEQVKEDFTYSTGAGAQYSKTIGLWDAVNAINVAAEDPNIKHIYLKTDGNVNSMATCEEIRTALDNFRKSGKGVIAYIESPGTLGYYVASVSDKIYMGRYHGGNINFNGVGGRMIFLKDLLDKFGVNMQLIRHGKYKSAGEMFIRNSSSPENREQNERMVVSMWETMRKTISEARNIPEERLDAAIDNLELCLPEDFLNAGLVDELVGRPELENHIAVLDVKDDIKDVNLINFAAYAEAKAELNLRSKKQIAVIYANGEIFDGTGTDGIYSDDFVKTLEEVRANKDVQAVVLRVNSPGGSVCASEKIKEQLDLLSEDKTIIASYGDYAASGGYWISNSCDYIFSDALTLTGSIGVFGMIPDFSKTAKDVLHIGVETIGSNKHSDMYSLTHTLDDSEIKYIQRSIEGIYDRFIHLVAEGRNMDVERVDELGQGRVWTGADAIERGLVDRIGTLEDAIRYACAAANDTELSNWRIQQYPAPPTLFENMMASFGTVDSEETVLIKKIRDNAKPQILARIDQELQLQ